MRTGRNHLNTLKRRAHREHLTKKKGEILVPLMSDKIASTTTLEFSLAEKFTLNLQIKNNHKKKKKEREGNLLLPLKLHGFSSTAVPSTIQSQLHYILL